VVFSRLEKVGLFFALFLSFLGGGEFFKFSAAPFAKR